MASGGGGIRTHGGRSPHPGSGRAHSAAMRPHQGGRRGIRTREGPVWSPTRFRDGRLNPLSQSAMRGGCGIRTREGVTPTAFPGRRHSPLGQPSMRGGDGIRTHERRDRRRLISSQLPCNHSGPPHLGAMGGDRRAARYAQTGAAVIPRLTACPTPDSNRKPPRSGRGDSASWSRRA
jgi:hypothetical protein